VVAVALVVPVALLGASAGIAAASGLSYGAADSSGNRAECNLTMSPEGHAFTSLADMQSYIGSDPTGANVWSSMTLENWSLYCNTAFPDSAFASGGTGGWYLIVKLGTSTSLPFLLEEYGPTVGYSEGCYHTNDVCSGGSSQDHVNQSGTPTNYPDGPASGSPQNVSCISASYYSSAEYLALTSTQQAVDQRYDCRTSGCWVTSYGDGYTEPVHSTAPSSTVTDGCGITTTVGGSYTAAVEPPAYWGTQPVVLPAAAPPVVTCGATVNSTTGVVAFTGAVAVPSGTTETTIAEGWAFGDSSVETGSTPNVNHPYTMTAEPSGGFVATYTAVEQGDGVTYASTSVTATCTKTISFVTGSGATGGGSPDTTNGGSAPPTSCGWTNFLCMIEQAAGWLFVPSGSATGAWTSFTTSLETHVPFEYVTGSVNLVYNVGTAVYNLSTGSPASCFNYTVGSSSGATTCVGLGSSSAVTDVKAVLSFVFTFAGILLVVRTAMRVVRSH
jgi:hypothetical protein